MKYSHPKHPNHADWQRGMTDGGETNPYFQPGDRTGEALASYKAGYEEVYDAMSEYLNQEEE